MKERLNFATETTGSKNIIPGLLEKANTFQLARIVDFRTILGTLDLVGSFGALNVLVKETNIGQRDLSCVLVVPRLLMLMGMLFPRAASRTTT